MRRVNIQVRVNRREGGNHRVKLKHKVRKEKDLKV